MRDKLIAFVIFCIIYTVRWVSYPSPLPTTWTPDKEVRYTARLLDYPEQTGTKTVIKQGRWRIELRGYQDLKLGEVYRFVGKIKTRVLGGKIVQIVMLEPTFEDDLNAQERDPTLGERLLVTTAKMRREMVTSLQKHLPEPHAALSAGILLGVSSSLPSDFYQELIKTGTLHIVAASGSNVTMVVGAVVATLSPLGRWVTLVGGVCTILLYVLLSGAGPSIVRAGVMGSLAMVATYLGRPKEARHLLALTGALMLVVDPLLVLSAGFWLSFFATAGILYLEPYFSRFVPLPGKYLKNLAYPTLSATVATLPVTLLWFGRVSLVGPLVNLLILPVVPLIMLLTVVALIFPPLALILYIPLEWMVLVIGWWS